MCSDTHLTAASKDPCNDKVKQTVQKKQKHMPYFRIGYSALVNVLDQKGDVCVESENSVAILREIVTRQLAKEKRKDLVLKLGKLSYWLGSQ